MLTNNTDPNQIASTLGTVWPGYTIVWVFLVNTANENKYLSFFYVYVFIIYRLKT